MLKILPATRLRRRAVRLALCLCALTALAGCGGFVTSAMSGFADNLSTAILEQEDPGIVADGAPTFMLMLDSLAASSPDEPALVGAAAELYALYATLFVAEPARAATLATRARDYGRQALCAADEDACTLEALDYDGFVAVLARLRPGAAPALYSYSIGSLAWVRANSGDFRALAALPRIEAALERVLALGAGEDAASVNLYLGVLNTLRPPALGGKPEVGRAYLEKAIDLSDGRDLSAKVELARGYARLVYDRELHDRLLNEVLAAEVKQPGLTLFNTLARRQAEQLLADADEYF